MRGPQEYHSLACPYGTEFARRVLQWWTQLQWYQGSPVSVLELYFTLISVSRPSCRFLSELRKVAGSFGTKNVEADVTSQRLGLQNHAWIQMMKWWIQKSPAEDLEVCGFNFLFQYGPTIPAWGVSLRPRLLHGARVSQELWSYLHYGGRTHRNFKRPWYPSKG